MLKKVRAIGYRNQNRMQAKLSHILGMNRIFCKSGLQIFSREYIGRIDKGYWNSWGVDRIRLRTEKG